MPSKLLARLEKLEADIAKKKAATVKTKSNAPAVEPREVTGRFGVPAVRKGEDPLTSRGFRVINLVKALTSDPRLDDSWQNSKVERDVVGKMKSAFGSGCGPANFESNSTLIPFGTELMPYDMANDNGFGRQIKSLMIAGVADADPDEVNRLVTKGYSSQGKAAQSWLDSTLGGSMVGPAQFGELIDLWRAKAALAQLGVTQIPMSPTGRMQWPRQTASTTGYWVGEGQAPTASQIGTGMMTLTAKKAGCYVIINNDLIRYAGPAAEAVVRNDMMTTLALTWDQAAIEGPSSDSGGRPLGIINTPNILTVTPTTVPTGNTGGILAEQDIYEFESVLEGALSTLDAFLMRPSMYYALLKRRNDAVSAADKKGAFTFSPFRRIEDGMSTKNINGARVVTTTQMTANRVQGSATTLHPILAGKWSEVMLAMFAGIELAVATQGDTIFPADQTALRAFQIGDVGLRRANAIALCDKLQAI